VGRHCQLFVRLRRNQATIFYIAEMLDHDQGAQYRNMLCWFNITKSLRLQQKNACFDESGSIDFMCTSCGVDQLRKARYGYGKNELKGIFEQNMSVTKRVNGLWQTLRIKMMRVKKSHRNTNAGRQYWAGKRSKAR
jgi:hypothetical protein